MYIYYVYQYLREDGTPYYIGKGKDRRMFAKHNVHLPNDKELIQVIAYKLSESEALLLETKLIKLYGRKDIGTGILRNLTGGGEGTCSKVWTDEAKSRVAIAKAEWHKRNNTSGENNPNYGNKWSADKRQAAKDRAVNQGFIGIRKGMPAWNKGKSLDDATRKKMSVTRLLTPKVTCQYCGIIVAPHILARYHSKKCKLATDDNLIS
jgi:hypothetical protein